MTNYTVSLVTLECFYQLLYQLVTTHKKKAAMNYMYSFFSAVNRDKVINIDFVLAVTDPV